MKSNRRLILIVLACLVAGSTQVFAESNRKERRLITKGNELYNNHKYIEAQSVYEEALKANGSSAEARYNLGLSQIRQVSNPADTTGANAQMVANARKNFTEVAAQSRTKPGIAAKANFNLGNIELKAKEYQKAIDYYKQALRIDPSDEKARKNLRIAQKNLQNQNNQDKNKNKDQNKDQNKEQNKDKNQNQNQNQNQEKEQPKPQNDLSKQTASQILQAVDNKENATRARINKANTGEKSGASNRNNRRW